MSGLAKTSHRIPEIKTTYAVDKPAYASRLKRPLGENSVARISPATTCSMLMIATSSIFSENHSWNVACRKISAVPLPMAMTAAGEASST